MDESKKAQPAAFLLLGVSFVVVLLLFIFTGGRMDGDGQNYYIYLRSLVFDGDLDLRNDYEMFPRDDPLIAHICVNAKGPAPNVFSIGPAIIWSPFFLVARLISIGMPPEYVGNLNQGKGEPYYTAICLASLIASFIGIIATYRLVRERLGSGPALLSTLSIWLAGSAIYYQVFEPFMSHALSIFAVSVFVLKAASVRQFQKHSDWVVLGLLAGLMSLVRWQDVIFAIIPAILLLLDWLAPERGRTGSRPPVTGIVISTAAAFAAFLPQMIAWKIIYGKFLTIPQTGGFIDPTRPHILDVLFSTRGGLFLWTPVALLGVIGLLRAASKRDRLALAMLPVFLLQVYLNASIMDWWGGEAFGARRFVCLFPILAYGLAALIAPRSSVAAVVGRPAGGRSVPRCAIALAMLLILSNAMLLTRYVTWELPRDRAPSLESLVQGQVTTAGEWLRWLAELPSAINLSYTLKAPLSTCYDALGLTAPGRGHNRVIDVGSDNEGLVFGDGWFQRERWGSRLFRWAGRRSITIFRAEAPGPAFLTITARALTGPSDFTASLNGRSLGPFTLADEWATVILPCPAGALRAGLNVLLLELTSALRTENAPHGFMIPHTDTLFDANLALASKDCGAGLASDIVIDGHEISPNRFGINVAAIDPARPQSFVVETLGFGASAAQQHELAGRLSEAPESALIAVSSKTFGLLQTNLDWLRKSLSLLTVGRRNLFTYGGIGRLRLMIKDAACKPRWLCDAPVSTLEEIAQLRSLLGTISADTVYVAAISEGEAPLQPELVEAFEEVGIDITVPHESRAPFVAIGGKLAAGHALIADVAEKGTASLRFGHFPDPRAITLALDRITLTSVSTANE
ncbi:MAG: glycosyltransferase family 39 protein [Candidatus Coatesbacteria bacterium]|nr:glycosyltransferase family 39 protein [Candidatus Coatesbacteria bacterium]